LAGTIIADKIQTENSFLTLNVGQTLVATINSSGILNSSGGTMISANGAVSNTAITGLVTAAQIATVANTQITGNITSSQITSDPTFYGNVSVTGTSTLTGNVSIANELSFNSGYGSVATAYGCRAWVNFNGIGTVAIRASGNVSSITDLSTGKYRVNFTTAMPDANYAAVFGTNPEGFGGTFSGSPGSGGTNSTTQCFIETRGVNNLPTDSDFIMCAILR
jgi:hypothetical protein